MTPRAWNTVNGVAPGEPFGLPPPSQLISRRPDGSGTGLTPLFGSPTAARKLSTAACVLAPVPEMIVRAGLVVGALTSAMRRAATRNRVIRIGQLLVKATLRMKTRTRTDGWYEYDACRRRKSLWHMRFQF